MTMSRADGFISMTPTASNTRLYNTTESRHFGKTVPLIKPYPLASDA
jgi:hypothetical protein